MKNNKANLLISSAIISVASNSTSGDREYNILSTALEAAIGSITDPEVLRNIAGLVLGEIGDDINDSEYFDCQSDIKALQSLSKNDAQTHNQKTKGIPLNSLAYEAANFIEDMPHPYDPEQHEEDLNEALYSIQLSLGQDDGGGAGVFFSNDDWFIQWNNCTSDESKIDLLRKYLVAEVSNYLTIKS